MKKILKTISIPLIALFLVACGDQGTETTSVESQAPESSVESAAESVSQEQTESVSEASDTTSAEESDAVSSEDNGDEATSQAGITFTLFVNGEETASFVAVDSDGLSVMEAMESIEDLEFNFNEDEGVIDEIDGIANDYDTGETWTYLLNGEFAELGVVSQTLSEDDVVEWYYGTIDEIPVNIVPAEE
ncbi:DUF4430 domain-containing protein [Fundicoccus culcitae]|uniref:DUF4430 domain-containing protein n=1 Tax=Fundicoccus culcitae TaxID=2969821 RepID=A0ABY5P2Y6_9LACT|nr:DUF4430 domain-containing protein [Fundicoccus culcitae]UUX32808.1 DUF4430 domain-containing protein [Fundicoccus culcitae]